MRKIKYLLLSIIVLPLLFVVTSCKLNFEDINILFTTDVHCGIDDNLGYSSFKAYKDDLKEEFSYVTTIDAGDAIQGGFVGAVSEGKYIVDIMNEVGYDIWTLGNHDFDYGIDTLKERIDEFNGDILSCNVSYTGSKENKLEKVKANTIIDYDGIYVGYIGITAPRTLTESNPKSFKEDGVTVYDFKLDKDEYYSTIQNNIDECIDDGADYIVLIAHVGNGDEESPYSCEDVVKNTRGVDAVISGHTHKNIECYYYQDLDGREIPVCEAGTKLAEFGHLVITPTGNIRIGYISKYDRHSDEIDTLINNIKAEIKNISDEVLFQSDIDLKISDSNGIRMVRTRETPIGNLVSDAYRIVGESNIGIVNGGAIRANLEKGPVTYQKIRDIHPFGNYICTVKAKGEIIANYLEFASKDTKSNYFEGANAVGEFGGFANVSGLKYTIDTSIESSVKMENNNFSSIDGERRVKNIMVLENGNYVPLDMNKEYIVTSHDFLLLNGGDGANMFMNCEVISRGDLYDYQVLVKYIKDILNCNLKDKYSNIEGRITVL